VGAHARRPQGQACASLHATAARQALTGSPCSKRLAVKRSHDCMRTRARTDSAFIPAACNSQRDQRDPRPS
jgi:hypothetical protein